MSLDALDPILSTPKKLAAIGMLANTKRVEFAFIRDHLSLSDSDLSKQMRTLVDVGYVEAKKTGRGADRRTWYSITAAGRGALHAHVAALNALVLDSLPPPTGESTPPLATHGFNGGGQATVPGT